MTDSKTYIENIDPLACIKYFTNILQMYHTYYTLFTCIVATVAFFSVKNTNISLFFKVLCKIWKVPSKVGLELFPSVQVFI